MMSLIATTVGMVLAGAASTWGGGRVADPLGEAAPAGLRASPSPESPGAAIRRVLGRVGPSVVRVFFGEGEMITGTIIREDGLVLTAAHVPVAVGGAVEIGLSDGRKVGATVSSKLPGEGESNLGKDLALIQINEGGPWPVVEVAEAAPAGMEEPLLAMGYPDTGLYGEDRSTHPLYVRLGRISRDPYQLREQLTTSIPGTGGDSGGPLFDLAGRVVGVVHAGDTSGAHLNYTKIEVLRRGWERLAPGKEMPKAAGGERGEVAPMSVVAEAARRVRGSVVEVCGEARVVGLGCVVGDGLILTKASELGPNLTVLLPDNFVAIAEVAATDPAHDLALLRLQYAPELTQGLEPVRWEAAGDAEAGTPVVLATPQQLTPLTGVVCFGPRPVAGLAGCLPCEVEDAAGGVRVTRIVEEIRHSRLRPVMLALRVGDTITQIEGQPVADRAAYLKLVFGGEKIGAHPLVSGEPVEVEYRRGERSAKAIVTLEYSRTPSTQLVRPASNRYSGYASAIATDLPARPEHCGGPVVDSEGRVIGLLIARAPFIEAFVLPAGEVADALKVMKESAGSKP